jgi:hypothetical protein
MSAEPARLEASVDHVAASTGMPWRKRLAILLALFSVAELVGSFFFASRGDPRFPVGKNIFEIAAMASIVLFPIVGALIIQRRPTTRVAWLMIASGVGLGLGLLTFAYGVTGLPPAPPRPFALEVALFSQLLFVPSIVSGTALIFLFFPTDRLPGPRWRWAVAMTVVGALLYELASLVRPGHLDPETFPGLVNPLAVPAALGPAVEIALGAGNAMTLAAVGLSALSLVLRYRRAGPVEAAQIRWIALVGGLLFVAFAVGALELGEVSDVAFGIGLILLALMPIAIGIAITRYHLYDIDRLINRTLVYGSLTAILAGVFTAGIAFARWLFVTATGETSDVAIVLTTLVVATLYAPLRKRLEAFVDRRFKYDEHRFGAYRSELKQLLSMVGPAGAAERLATEAFEELSATGAAVVDDKDQAIATAGEWPVPAVARLAIPGGRGGLKAILVGPRRDGEPHDPRAITELQEVAALAARAVVRSEG